MDWLVQACGLPERFLCAPVNAEAAPGAAATTNSSSSSSSSSGNGTKAAAESGSSSGGAERKGGGVIQGTSSEAVLVAMLAARARALEGQPPEAVLKLVAYGSDQVGRCSGLVSSMLDHTM
jgi:hypothetical protein